MGKNKSYLYLAVIIVLIVGLSGCTSRQQADGAKLNSITIGVQPSTHQVAEMIAMDKGWWQDTFSKYGITKTEDKLFPSGPPEMQAMLGGELDIAYVGAAPAISAISKGLDAKIVAAVQISGSALVLKPELADNYKGPKDLIGKKIATFPSGSIQDSVLKHWLKQNNIDPDKDLRIVAMGPGDAITAIEAGNIDGTFLPAPSPSKIELDKKGKMVELSGTMWPDHACCVIVVSGKLIREYPDMVKEIINTHIKATEYIYSDTDDAKKICAKKIKLSEEVIDYSLEHWDGAWITDPNEITDSVLSFAKVQYDLGYIEKMPKQEDLFDMSFYNQIQSVPQ
ncbi:MAG: sulfonate ABC transporter substrate-binding protein [Candidatus Nanohalarchaeota archaeon]|nr:MAG: sulfonate ABC transporter substrate-binding protein [Candidatus Nanohaloarchaeota archaeon]